MSKRETKHVGPPGFWGTLWRLGLSGTLLFSIAGMAGYLVVQRLVQVPEEQAPDLLTLTLADAVERASDSGFATRLAGREASEVLEPGQIIAQRPQPGDWLKPGATILLTVAE